MRLILRNLFFLEEKILQKFGYWPCNKIVYWKIWTFLILHITFILIPQIVYTIKSINSNNYLNLVAVASINLVAFMIILAPLNVVIKREKFNKLVANIKSKWLIHSSDEFPKWNQQRNKIVKIGNKCTFYTLCIILLTASSFYYIFNLIIFLRYLLSDLDVMDPSINRETLLKVDFGFNWEYTPFLFYYKLAIIIPHALIITNIIAIQSFYLKLVNYAASFFKLLNERIDKIDELLKSRSSDDVIQNEIKQFVEDHVDALE
ncbi:unnamed protein product [Chironomus riparius]|uniref:Odorant receptor n=1 Tax=Chironomus riparius TaxID=315576 RepID=A0A9N9RGU3_9DIPT|nr:unnamed protein product [Chironomus riparius]